MPRPYVEVKQDESTGIVKTLQVCQCPGCGIPHEGKGRFCADHATAAQREETIAEHERKLRKEPASNTI